MKKILTTTIFLFISGIIFAQDRSKDEAAINKQVDAMIYSWNHHNYDDMKNYTTENTDWVNVVGMWWKGRKESQYAHQAYHNTIFKTSVGEKKSVSIRFVTNDVAIAHLMCHFSDPHPIPLPDGKEPGPTDDLATLVYVKQNGKWLMTAGENVHIDKGAQQFDPVKQMPKN
ncbi:SgcJ/EcaC family oxidoreductase [uncultured Mucilaginibacter sp.]|uniref:SgcJ/EcaC family oxidoreductase n=1 Tax=uncultured Mucilaginibacter sp. TaxID=797541 RepID=UPI002625F70D|nr:SgcJ/EcaC family oxidoreductase [uncultured Mucilaginibacter sp.]